MDWIQYTEQKKFELDAQDPGSVISDTALETNMLRCAELNQKDRAQAISASVSVLFATLP